MRESAGQTTKSALFHTYTRDTRDDALLCTRGAYVRLAHEFAGLGLGGDAAFVKSEGSAMLGRALGRGVVSLFAYRIVRCLVLTRLRR